MENKEILEQIRENEKQSHTALYSSETLYQDGSWLRKPVKTVLELFPHFEKHTSLNVLDLGCGVGRNCIAIAQHFRDIPCTIDCVDILDIAIEKLNKNAKEYGVSASICGIAEPIDDFSIPSDQYDLILAVSALEHVDSEASFVRKLAEIRDGVRKNGIVCMVINSDVREYDKLTGNAVPAQFEVNLPTAKLQEMLHETFAGWNILKSTVREQRYEIPRGERVSDLQTDVVTFVAKNIWQPLKTLF